jgi:transposase InsO family protein
MGSRAIFQGHSSQWRRSVICTSNINHILIVVFAAWGRAVIAAKAGLLKRMRLRPPDQSPQGSKNGSADNSNHRPPDHRHLQQHRPAAGHCYLHNRYHLAANERGPASWSNSGSLDSWAGAMWLLKVGAQCAVPQYRERL